MKSENAKTLCLCYVEVFLIALDTIIWGMKILKMWLIEFNLTRQSSEKQKRREKFNKPTTQESSSPSGGECEICAINFFSL